MTHEDGISPPLYRGLYTHTLCGAQSQSPHTECGNFHLYLYTLFGGIASSPRESFKFLKEIEREQRLRVDAPACPCRERESDSELHKSDYLVNRCAETREATSHHAYSPQGPTHPPSVAKTIGEYFTAGRAHSPLPRPHRISTPAPGALPSPCPTVKCTPGSGSPRYNEPEAWSSRCERVGAHLGHFASRQRRARRVFRGVCVAAKPGAHLAANPP
jgi:hypothetical protein